MLVEIPSSAGSRACLKLLEALSTLKKGRKMASESVINWQNSVK